MAPTLMPSNPLASSLFKPGYGGPAELFCVLYFMATGIHAVHLTIGVGLVLAMARREGTAWGCNRHRGCS